MVNDALAAYLDAEKRLGRMREDTDPEVYDENMTVAAYLDKWLDSSVRESTFDCYEVICRRHIIPALGRMKLSKLTPVQVQGFYRDKLDSGLASASVHKCHTVLHKALGQAVKWHLIPRNVCDAAKAPRPVPEKEMRTLSPEETRCLLDTVRGDMFEALYVLAITTGMRQGELLGLKWQDVDLETGTLRVRRTLTGHGGKVALGEQDQKESPHRLSHRDGVTCPQGTPGVSARGDRAVGRCSSGSGTRVHYGGRYPYQPL